MRNEHEAEVVAETEVRELLERLHAAHHEFETRTSSPPDQVTVDDIAEAVGLDPETVLAELQKMHAEQAEARLSRGLRDLEEPLYRVERPGIGPTLGHENPLFRLQSIRTLAERQRRGEFGRRPVDLRPSPEDQLITRLILGALAVGVVLILVSAWLR